MIVKLAEAFEKEIFYLALFETEGHSCLKLYHSSLRLQREGKDREEEAEGEKGMRALCLLSCFLLSRGIVNFGV